MREMKESGVGWIGTIPADWGIDQAGQHLSQVKYKNEGMRETNLLSLSYGKIKRRSIDATEGLLPESFETYNIIEPGDIVLRFTDLQNDQKSLRVGRSTERGIITSAYATVRPSNSEESRYLYYALHSFDVRKGFYGMGSGVRQGLKWQEARYIKLPLPSLDEQRRIADFLDAKCAEIDRAVISAEASIEEYKGFLASIVSKSVQPLKGDGLHWRSIPFKYLYAEFSESGHAEEELLSVYLDRGVIRYSDSTGMQVHKPSDSLDAYQLVLPSCFVMNNQQAWRGSVGVSRYRGIISPAYHVYKPTSSQTDSVFMNYLLRSTMVSDYELCSRGVGSIQRILNKREMGRVLITIPDLPEQRRIADYLDAKCAAIADAIAAKKAIIDDLKAYKQSLIYEVVTGKREV